MEISITAISDPKRFAIIKDQWDYFIMKNNANPFFLYEFVERQMQSSLAKGDTPIILIFKAIENIVGVVPLLIRNHDKVRSASFLFEIYFTPDFKFVDNYKDICMKLTLKYIFKKLRCKFVNFDVSASSPNIESLLAISRKNSVSVRIKKGDIYNNAVIQVQDSWENFKQLRGRNFIKKMSQVQRRLENAGSWEAPCFENNQNEEDVFRKIMEIEEACWKQNWRFQRNHKLDEDLSNLWAGSNIALRAHPELKRRVWLLYLNGKVIAYNLAIEYRGIVYMCKTSFNNKYRNLYPGIFLVNKAIQDVFQYSNIRMIDFMSNLPFHERWTRNRLVRVRVLLTKGIIPKVYELIVGLSEKSNALQLIYRGLNGLRSS